jgi:hypothetical protein
MTTGHLSEMELQQYVLDPAACTKESIAHIGACEHCRAEASIYQLLIAGINEQPKAAFDFDLSALVLSRLPEMGAVNAESRDARRFGFSAWIMIALVACTIGISLYLFRKNIWNTFTGISGLFMYLILGAAAIVVALRILAMYKKYQRQMDRLNFY